MTEPSRQTRFKTIFFGSMAFLSIAGIMEALIIFQIAPQVHASSITQPSSVMDTDFFRYWTAGAAPNVGAGQNFLGTGWVTDGTTVNGGSSPPYNGIGIAKATGAHYAFLGTAIPTGWIGAVNLKAFYTLKINNTGTGTGTHDYALSCWTPGVTNLSVAPTFSTAVSVTFNVVTNGIGALDVPVFSGWIHPRLQCRRHDAFQNNPAKYRNSPG